MIAELGHYALILALALALVQGIVPLIGAARDDGAWMAVGRSAAAAQFLFVSLSFAALMQAYVVSDFSLANVAANSHSAKPLLYKITGTWGNHEGSLLLWAWILAFYGVLVAALGGNLPPALRARVLAIQGLIGAGFLLFMLATSNPFLRLDPAPAQGNDLNPLLQDPGLAFHPPVLYLGYVGLSTTFAFAIAGLIEGRIGPAWARWVRPWALVAWTFLSAGIALGSWWAYYELGWGGFWFWDPVENASFMPWLAATALLHSAIVCEKRGSLKAWTVLLAILAFSLSLLGTFLVRSGVLTSVHAFATDPTRGVFILAFLAFVVGGALTLYAVRAPQLKGGGGFRALSREGALLLNNLLLCTACVTVLIGTLYPVLLDVTGGGKVSVGPPFFELTFVPLMVPLVLLTAAGPLLAWKRADLAAATRALKLAFAAAFAVAAATLALAEGVAPQGVIALALAAWLAGGVGAEWAERVKLFRAPWRESLRRARGLPRAHYGMSCAHLGLALIVASIAAFTLWQSEMARVMKIGESAPIAGYELTLLAVEEVPGPNYVAMRARFGLARAGGEAMAELAPEKRRYAVGGRETTEAAIYTTGFSDVYAVIGDPAEGGGYAVRAYVNPMVPGIWWGVGLLVIGGALSLSDRRLRIGYPARARRDHTVSTPA